YYGVRADIATYGKVIGGGLPLAVIAGSAHWLDALDGGDWQFGDDSFPEAGVTYFAGTFVRHPLALAAARASLLHLKRQGPRLQADIAARTSSLIERLNANLAELKAPVKVVGFSSLWRILVDDDQPFSGLLWYAFRERGLHVYEQFNCFFTEAHGELEIEEIVDRVSAAVRALLDAHLLTRVSSQAAVGPFKLLATPELPADWFALSDGQRDKWLACQYGDEANTAFNESMLLMLDGTLDVAALTRSLTHIASRHDAFQLHFNTEGRGQTFDSEARLRLSHVDLTGADVDARLRVHCQSQMSRPFDLEQAPLARVQLIRLATTRHALLFIGHHLIFDGWSAAVVLDELALGYNAAVSASVAMLPAAESYRSYVEAERSRRSGADGAASISYWKDQFATLPGALSLPSDRPRSRQPEFSAATLATDFPAELTLALRAQARRRSVTLYSLLLHGFARLLAELSGQRDLVIGIPFAGQAVAGSGHLVGDGADMLPLRLQLDAATHSDDALLATHRRLLDAADHQDLSLNTLIRNGVLPTAGNGLTRVVFNLNPRVPPLQFSGLEHSLRDCPKTALFWDLFINLSEIEDHLSLDLHYASALFDADTISTFAARYRALLEELADPAAKTNVIGVAPTPTTEVNRAIDEASTPIKADSALAQHELEPNRMLDSILAAAASQPASLPSESDLAGDTVARTAKNRRVVAPAMAEPVVPDGSAKADVALHGIEVAVDATASLPALLAAQADATPLRIAVESGERRLTYAGLLQRVDTLAAHLIERGIERGELVGVSVPRGVEMLIATLAVQRAGAAYVALDPHFPEERLRDIAEQSALRNIVTLVAGDVVAGLAEGRQLIAIETLDLRRAVEADLPAISGDDLAYVLFTSGSTGRPKGVRVLQRNLVNFLQSMLQAPGMVADDALVAVTTLSFDIAGLELYLPLLCGARIVIANDDEVTDPQALAQLIRDCDVSVMQTTPTLLRLLLDGGGDDAVAGLRLLVGGEALPRNLADRALVHASELWNMYGPTETTIWSSIQRVEPNASDIALGQPIANTSIHLLDDSGLAVGPGERGEIMIGGAGIADGYLNRDDLTAERFVPDRHRGGSARLYRTGDIGSIRDGRLYYHGRSDHQVKIRGHRIELGDIEATAVQLPVLRDAVASTHEAAPGDMRLLLYVSTRKPNHDPTDALRVHLRAHLPGYMLPQQIIVLDELPRTPNGKIDRKALPMPAPLPVSQELPTADDADDLDRADSGRDAQTAWLAKLWCDMIGVRDIADDDNFFEIGGHSLLAVEMATHVQKQTGFRMNLLMIATGTLASLAGMLPPMGEGASKPSAISKVLGMFGLGKTPA
ncbi:MAG: amino acid adenylation domain-containing protein, partial [Dokdonella sp.]